MRPWMLCCGAALLLGDPARLVAAQDDCLTGKPVVLTRALTPVYGQGPLWVTAGAGPIKWDGPNDPIQLIWVRDVAVRGQAMVFGKNRTSGTALRFTKFGDRMGERQNRWTLNPLGHKPKLATPKDFEKYGFDITYAWFPEPGCYEISGRVGAQQVAINLLVGKPAGE